MINGWIEVKREGIIAKKRVDKSTFTNAITIPKKYIDKFLKEIEKYNLQKGESQEIILLIHNKEFRAIFRYVDMEKRDDVYQINFRKEIKDYLKSKLYKSYKYIFEYNENPNMERPNEYIEFYKTDRPNTLKLKLVTDDNFEFVKSNNDVTMKQEFFSYIEPKGKFSGSKYQKSYKIVLLMSLLKLADDDGKAVYEDVCSDIRDMYLNRHKNGLAAEEMVSDIQREIENLTVNTVKKVMNENSYNVINKKGYIFKENIDTIEYLRFNKNLWNEFTKEDKENLKDILNDKLALYYNFKNLEESERSMEVLEENFVPNKVIDNIYKYMLSKGYTYSIDIIKNFYLSLKAKPFVILYGISGTGKSKLVELFANAIGANKKDGTYNLIPVRPDWSDGSELIGYKNIQSKFQIGIITNIIKEACKNKNKPYFICLDEMNLARVEYYFSDILSIMESRKRIDDEIITDNLIRRELFSDDEEAKNLYGELYIPENLYIIGTVNMDETTFPFSKKVLDRANTIEFNDVNLSFDFDIFENKGQVLNKRYANNLLCSKYVKIIECREKRNIAENVIDELKEINKILQKSEMHFAYRVRDEITYYVIYAVDENIMEFNKALDYEIKQKILPRIQGNSEEIEKCLLDLFIHCTGMNKSNINYDYIEEESLNKMQKYLEQDKENEEELYKNIKYPKSAKKILKMIRRFNKDGFTTFW